MSTRQKILFGLLGVVICVGVVKWLLGDGRVTLDFTDAPLSKVIKSVEWQGGIKIITDGDPALPITIHLKRAPLLEAVDTVAIRAGGFVRLTYVGAPDDRKLSAGLEAFATGAGPAGWKTFSSFGGFGGPMGGMGQGGDPRMLEWKLSDPGDRSLQAFNRCNRLYGDGHVVAQLADPAP